MRPKDSSKRFRAHFALSVAPGSSCLKSTSKKTMIGAMLENLSFKLNGKSVRLTVDGDRPLLWVLRCDLGLTGTKYGCGTGLCGTCTVLVNDQPVRSCQTTVNEVKDKRVLTIEGLAANGRLHPLQQAFVEHNAFQCGFCTSGMILTAYALLLKKPEASVSEIAESLESNLCRCGSHTRVLAAVRQVAEKKMKGVRS